MQTDRNEAPVLLEAKGICKYFGGLKAVENVDMQVRKGDIFGIIGPNGAGKTTFFNMCTGVYPPTKGKIYKSGEDITGLKPERVARKRIARTFQNIQLFKFMTVLENVKIGCHINTTVNVFDAILKDGKYRREEKQTSERCYEILKEIGLDHFATTLAGNLPYGHQRKVEIARALALDPEVLLLDEPAAGMNPNETEDLREFIISLNRQGYTIVVIEHDMKFIMRSCNHILVLNFGQKLFEGTPDEVKENHDVQVAYFGKNLAMRG
ncbi:MAG: ABC transporter ATP-binding protein [Clostridia bacterium]|nr:ABC transporter ATP-binding protein [Clostridia bacterium]